MKKIILICLVIFLSSCGENKADKENIDSSTQKLVGIYLGFEDGPMVVSFNQDGTLSKAEFNSRGGERAYWRQDAGSWEIVGNEICVTIMDDPEECREYGFVGNDLVIKMSSRKKMTFTKLGQ